MAILDTESSLFLDSTKSRRMVERLARFLIKSFSIQVFKIKKSPAEPGERGSRFCARASAKKFSRRIIPL